MGDDDAVSKEYTGKAHPKLDRRKLGKHQKSVRSINDKTRSHKLYNDNGIHQIDMKKVRSRKACRRKKAGSYYYEHNQGGSGGWSVGIGVGFLNINYSGSPSVTFRRAAKFNYF